MSGEPIVFLDKDGTLIEDLPYNVEPARVRFAPGSRFGVRLFAANGWRLAIASNQSAVGRGYTSEAAVRLLGRHLADMLAAEGAELAGFYFCPHRPTDAMRDGVSCLCRKPGTGLIGRAAAELRVDLARSWFIGDTWMDVVAGRAAGCRTVLVGRDWRQAARFPHEARPDAALPDLLAAATLIGPRPQATPRDEGTDPRQAHLARPGTRLGGVA